MVDFQQTAPFIKRPKRRIMPQDVVSKAIGPRALAQTTLVNTDVEIIGPIALSNGASLSLLSIIANTSNENFRLGASPYSIAFFQDALSATNLIGAGIMGDYTINGPLSMPQFDPQSENGSLGGSDGNNLIFITELTNNSGGSQDIYIAVNCRIYSPIGGVVVQTNEVL